MEPIVVGGYLLLMNIVGLYVMYSDKRRAIKHRFRIPERTLFIVSLFGGSIGTWAGMYLFRHKTKHWYFVIGIPLIIFIQFIIAYQFDCFSFLAASIIC